MFMKPIAAAVALSVATLTFAAPAQADHRHHHHNGGNVAAAGIVGLAAGALLGSALTAPRYNGTVVVDPVYVEPAPVYVQPAPVYVQPAPVYVQPVPVVYQAWTPEWYSYCQTKYQSFDRRTGMFVTYTGERRLCY